MELNEAIKELKNIWKETDFKNSKRRIAIEKVLQTLEDLEKQINKIREEFLQYDWKNSNSEQVHNQLKSLYESIYK